jgi:hypothetical protein
MQMPQPTLVLRFSQQMTQPWDDPKGRKQGLCMTHLNGGTWVGAKGRLATLGWCKREFSIF